MAKRGSNIYKRKDGRFEGRVSVGYKENGKTKYRYVYGHSLAEVKEKMAQVYSGKNTQEQSKNKMIVRDIAEQWLAEKKLTVKAASYTVTVICSIIIFIRSLGEFGIPRLPSKC